MPRFRYTAQDGEDAFIHLPAKRGFTSMISWLSPPERKIAEKVRQDLRGLGLSLVPETDHLVYNESDRSLAVVVQPGQAKRATDSEGNGPTEVTILIHRGRREWIAVAKKPDWLVVDENPVSLMRIIKDGMRIRLGSLSLVFQEIDEVELDEERLSVIVDKHCPFCGDTLAVGELVIACPACDTVQHAMCWDAYGGRCSGLPGCPYGMNPRNRNDSVET